MIATCSTSETVVSWAAFAVAFTASFVVAFLLVARRGTR